MRTLVHRITLSSTEAIDLVVLSSGIYINGRRTTGEWIDLLGVFCVAGCNEARHDVTLMVTEDLECFAVPMALAQRAIEAYEDASMPRDLNQ